jgi:N-methylhydantoinase A/oxoprolinase/acetone carboxylase beta subunit
MRITLGIDTGGTYTDAVLFDHHSEAVIASAKALTTYHDLSQGIDAAIEAVFEGAPAPAGVTFVSLSTTLATNALVEGRGSPVCLLLLGYDPQLIEQYGFEDDLVTDDVHYLAGGHDEAGDPKEPLDEAAVRAVIRERRDAVEAFAVSGYFSVRNPAHELRVRELVEALTGDRPGGPLPVTCGHELTTRLNAVRRATTVTLNARLIPLLRELIATVRRTLDRRGIDAPLMVVRGDGSLVRSDWALRRPIETILSGPAASVVGAWHLAGRGDVWVVDVGGTTTDIAALRAGRPRLNEDGAQVGPWRTMVEAVDVHTVGLGGDSEVHGRPDGHLTIGPRRVVPLSLLAAQHPQVVEALRKQVRGDPHERWMGQFVLRQREAGHDLAPQDAEILRRVAPGPRPLAALIDELGYGSLTAHRVEKLERRRLILRAGFTPTDALHALGRLTCWDVEAARLGAELVAARTGSSPEALCQRVVEGVSDRASRALVSKVLQDEVGPPRWAQEPTAEALLSRALGGVPATDLACRLTLRQPLVAIGAPVAAYLPRVADQLGTELIIPTHADVANAVGAVVGGVTQQLRVLIRPLRNDHHFRLHTPFGIEDFTDLEDAVAHARRVVSEHLRDLARRAGAEQVEVHVTRTDQEVPVLVSWGEEIYLGTELTFTAAGRPRPTA